MEIGDCFGKEFCQKESIRFILVQSEWIRNYFSIRINLGSEFSKPNESEVKMILIKSNWYLRLRRIDLDRFLTDLYQTRFETLY